MNKDLVARMPTWTEASQLIEELSMSGVNPSSLGADGLLVTAPSLFYKGPLLTLTEWIGRIILSVHVNHLPLTEAAG